MLSRRAVLAGGVAALAAPPILARAQSSTGGATPPTILRLERRDIEVNGKTASVYGIRQPDGTFGLTTEVGKPFRVRVENGDRRAEPDPLARADARPGGRTGCRGFPDPRFPQAAAPTTTSPCASAARSGCTRIRGCRSSG